MTEENLICSVCGGLHPAGHRDKELEDRLEAIEKILEKTVPFPLEWQTALGKIRKIVRGSEQTPKEAEG